MSNTLIQLLDTPIDTAALLRHCEDPAAGGHCLFVGTVRNHNHGEAVDYLEYEAYAPMALKLMEVLATHLLTTHDCLRLALVHRLGHLAIGDIAVAVAVSAVHRDTAFVACREGIDRLKLEIPIWKKERFAGGARWVDNCEGCAASAAEYADQLLAHPHHHPHGPIDRPGQLLPSK
ncbi:MAG: molybdenum cofactor biosynthesis protein MoaE [bacterium]